MLKERSIMNLNHFGRAAKSGCTADKVNKDREEKQSSIDNILKDIDLTAENGEYSLSLWMNPKKVKSLEKHGYQVEIADHNAKSGQMRYYTIFWE